MMNMDISPLLNKWEYDSEKNVRVIKLEDNRKVIQVRKVLGIEQYELEGRPDGKKPFGKASVLAEFNDRIHDYKKNHGSEEGFMIDHDDFLLLQYEAVLNYYRYLILFQIGDFKRTVRDTNSNLRICDLLQNYCLDDEDKNQILQYKPYIIRVNALARAMIHIRRNLPEIAQQIIESAIVQIKDLPDYKSETYQYEKIRSINYLKATLAEINQKPLSEIEKLKLELEDALEIEDYERAAEIRDKIHELSEKTDNKI
ncbi:MAG: UvrB/UvrC motif-containing protein [Spirochaetales bacterium]|nr:UvrB/UvrC motif-containing protein [Spirochaetales bacterium]